MTTATDEAIRLNIGAGDVVIEGFIAIDRKFGKEAYPLDYEDNSVEEIRASHILEHFQWSNTLDVLKDWVRVLKPNGLIKIAVPDFDKCIEARDRGDKNWKHYIMGGDMDENDRHGTLWTREDLEACMKHVGLMDIEEWHSSNTDTSCHAVSLNLKGIKTETPIENTPEVTRREVTFDIPSMQAVMACPRLCFTDNMLCATKNLTRHNVPFQVVRGCFWGQNLERTISEALKSDCEWIITLDYDTVFSETQFTGLLYYFQKYPEIDALAPIQSKREGDTCLFWDTDEDGIPKVEWNGADFHTDTMPIRHAHFGYTIFRADKLRQFPHPWFYAQPNLDGTWNENRMDDDIFFWEKWRAAGNSLHLANRVPVGHMQMVVTWPGEDLKPIHQYVNDFEKNGPPEGIWK